MANTLPSHSQAGQVAPSGMATQQIPGQQVYPGPGPVHAQYLPPGGQPVPQQHPGQPQIQAQPPQQQQQQQQQQQNDTQLISFD